MFWEILSTLPNNSIIISALVVGVIFSKRTVVASWLGELASGLYETTPLLNSKKYIVKRVPGW